MVFSTKKSWEKYELSLKSLSGGSSTNSKKPRFKGFEPGLIVRGKGCRVWDLDNNEYIDFRNGLGPVSLGYNIPEINEAIIKQLNDGIIFGHPHPLEGEVAKLLVDIIPCADRVRFLKTGGEAVAACIKIARNATGRDKVLHCGYNGWLNVLSVPVGYRPVGVANQAFTGVPLPVQALHKSMPWGYTAAWEKIFEEEGRNIAAVVIASDYAEIDKGKEFLPAIRQLTKKYGILMIMDEIVTGFRLSLGGAHEYFNFMPDMAVYAKGLANGMPFSVYSGRADLIDSSPNLGISSTFGGDTLALAAVKATVKFYQQKKVIKHLWKVGDKMQDGVNNLFNKYKINAGMKGYSVCPWISFPNPSELELFYKYSYKNGVSLYTLSFVNYSHKDKDINEALERIEKAIKEMRDADN